MTEDDLIAWSVYAAIGLAVTTILTLATRARNRRCPALANDPLWDAFGALCFGALWPIGIPLYVLAGVMTP